MSVSSLARFYQGLVVSLKTARGSQNPERIARTAGRLLQELTAVKCHYEAEPKELMVGLRCLSELRGYKFSLGQCKLLNRVISRLNLEGLSSKNAAILTLFSRHLNQRIEYLFSADPAERIKPFMDRINDTQNVQHRIYLAVSCIQEILAWMEIHQDSPELKAALNKCLDVLSNIGLSLSPGEHDVVHTAISKVDDPAPYMHLIGYKRV